jgi:hypothetical protein
MTTNRRARKRPRGAGHAASDVDLVPAQRIDAITAFLKPELFERFGLAALPAAAPS